MKSVELGEWHSVDNVKEEKSFAQKMAEENLKKDARINIRLSPADLERIKRLAAPDFENTKYN